MNEKMTAKCRRLLSASLKKKLVYLENSMKPETK